jgi:hypothetical protein
MSSPSSPPGDASEAAHGVERHGAVPRFGALQDYLILSALFLVSRAALYALGLRFKLVLDWMFLADLADLRERLWETVYYFHAFPPGWNLLTGVLLKLSPDHVAGMAHALFIACGLLMVNSLLYLARVVGVPRWAGLGLSFAFAIIPPTLFFENLYLYDYPVPALLTFAAALFHRALVRRSFWLWFGMFGVCALLGLLRSALHLVWFLAILGASLWLVKDARRKILLAAAAPAAVLLLLYTKNWLVFGVFDSQTQSGGNAILITTYHMPRGLRKAWVEQGKLSPFADMSFAAPPRDFLPYFNTTENELWPEHQLTELERPSNGAPNYNHWFFLEVNQWRRQDAMYCLTHRPRQYVRTVFGRSLPQAFSPSTRWHPFTGKPASPHYAHHQVLGAYEDVYNRVLHQLFLAPVGFYVFLPLCLYWVAKRAWPLVRSADEQERAVGALWYFCLLQIGYLVTVIALLTWGENARYRYIVEPLIWLVAARSVLDLVRRAKVELARYWPALAARQTAGKHAL